MKTKKYLIELSMACLLIISFYYLSRQAASVSAVMSANDHTALGSRKRIAIDAGHGGADPGMIGCDGIEEKGINLQIALKLKTILEDTGQYSVIMTREKDEGLYETDAVNKKVQDMQKRIALLAEQTPLLTVSIHQNSYQDPAVCGPQVFYYESSLQGKLLAEKIQSCLNEKLEVKRPRKIKANTSYYLLKRSKGVLVIVECGFLTNPEEAALLQKEEYQEKISEAVADGIMEYINSSQENKI